MSVYQRCLRHRLDPSRIFRQAHSRAPPALLVIASTTLPRLNPSDLPPSSILCLPSASPLVLPLARSRVSPSFHPEAPFTRRSNRIPARWLPTITSRPTARSPPRRSTHTSSHSRASSPRSRRSTRRPRVISRKSTCRLPPPPSSSLSSFLSRFCAHLPRNRASVC